MIYWLLRQFIREVFRRTQRIGTLGIERTRRPGGYVLACSHVSHFDPFCVSAVLPGRIGWMARIEFYEHPISARLLRLLHAFPVKRQGVPVRAIRESLRRLRRGEVVGVFPEGEIRRGAESVLRGAPIKRGVCLLAANSGKPVLPCILLGSEKLSAIAPWIPYRRGKLWVACGEFIEPVPGPNRRAARHRMAQEIEAALQQLYVQVCAKFSLEDSVLP